MAIEHEQRPERALLVGVVAGGAKDGGEEVLEELSLLTRTAGGVVGGRLCMRRGSIHPATFLSRGKLEELQRLTEEHNVDLVIFDDDLSPAQLRNLEQAVSRRVIDRTELILDIFARRARTREAQLQVELAQLQYLLPRLTRMWGHLSRLGGGIGTRGPGETQLEVDRRRIRHRIAFLKRGLEAIDREREIQSRRRRSMFRASLVGYTNAGKSTLFNTLTHAGVIEEDLLFATLDTTTRRLALGDSGQPGDTILLSDTVGFIRKLPHHLVASFRATLREVRESDLLIHVVDASQPNYVDQMRAVEEVVTALLDGGSARWMLVLNKSDLLAEELRIGLKAKYPDAHILSALNRESLEEFRLALRETARAARIPTKSFSMEAPQS